MHLTEQRPTRLFFLLGGFFLANALIAEFIGVKIFSLEASLGLPPLRWPLLGLELNLEFTAGVLLWPVVFVMTDLVNEYFGKKGVRFLSYFAVGLISYAFLAVFAAIKLMPASWWTSSYGEQGVSDMQTAFSAVFGQGLWIILGSLVAFLLGQLVDVYVFQAIKRRTGEGKIWLRATGSTLISQFIDSYVVLYIAFVLGGSWSMNQFLAVGLVNYVYKFFMAIALTPVLYLVHAIIDRYLGDSLATELKTAALGEED